MSELQELFCVKVCRAQDGLVCYTEGPVDPVNGLSVEARTGLAAWLRSFADQLDRANEGK